MKFKLRQLLMPHFADDAGADGGADGGGGAASATPSDDAGSGGATATLSMGAPGSAAGEGDKGALDFKTLVPQEYQDKPYMQELLKHESPETELFKQFDGLQSKLGQRPEGVPKEDASDEDWTKFYRSLGMPEKADEYSYELPTFEGEDAAIGEFIKNSRSTEFEADIKGLAHEAKLTAKQWDIMSKGFDALSVKHNKDVLMKAANAEKELNQGFDNLADETFGDKADEALALGKKMLDAHTPKELQGHLSNLSNEALVVMAGVLNNIYNQYGKEDTFDFKGDATSGGGRSEISEEGRKLMAHPAYSDPFHPEHESYVKRVQENYARLK